MSKEHILYLDESRSVDNIFVIGGFAIPLKNVGSLQHNFNELKKRTWPNLISNEKRPVFHAVEHLKKKPEAFLDMIRLIKEEDAKVFACAIKLDELYELYGDDRKDREMNNYSLVDSEFNIALQKVIENYTHYLYKEKAFGKTMYEGRNNDDQIWFNSPDFFLKANYQTIIANNKGLGYINDAAVKYCNTGFTVKQKKEDVAGLQIADTIAYVIAKCMSPNVSTSDEVEEMFTEIFRISYNGGFNKKEKDLRNYYGIRILPEFLRTVYIEREMRQQKKYINAEINELEKKLNRLKRECANIKDLDDGEE